MQLLTQGLRRCCVFSGVRLSASRRGPAHIAWALGGRLGTKGVSIAINFALMKLNPKPLNLKTEVPGAFISLPLFCMIVSEWEKNEHRNIYTRHSRLSYSKFIGLIINMSIVFPIPNSRQKSVALELTFNNVMRISPFGSLAIKCHTQEIRIC